MIIRRYFILSLSALMLAGCAGNDISDTPDEERLPLRFETTLSNRLPVTRAVDDKIDSYFNSVLDTILDTEPE